MIELTEQQSTGSAVEDVRASGEVVDRIVAEDDAHDPYLQSYQSIP